MLPESYTWWVEATGPAQAIRPQNPHPEPFCALLSGVLITVVLRPGCTSEIQELVKRIRSSLPQPKGTCVDPREMLCQAPGGLSDVQPILVAMATLDSHLPP